MKKDFDQWNENKKIVHQRDVEKEFFPKEREVWWCSLGVNVGVETDGKNDTFERPVLVVRVFNREMLWAVPVTTAKRELPFYYPFSFKNEDRSAMLTQLRIVSTKRLQRRVDTISEKDFQEVLSALTDLLTKAKPLHKGGVSRRPKP